MNTDRREVKLNDYMHWGQRRVQVTEIELHVRMDTANRIAHKDVRVERHNIKPFIFKCG